MGEPPVATMAIAPFACERHVRPSDSAAHSPKAGLYHPARFPGTGVLVLFIEGCDLRCCFCRAPQAPGGVRPTSLDEAKALLRSAEAAERLIVTGGEPTSRGDLPELCGEALRLGYRAIQLQTHGGRLADPTFTRILKEAGVAAVDVPLYGARPDPHDRVTGVGGSFRRALAGARQAREAGMELAIHATVFRSTLSEVPGLLRLAADLGARHFSLEPVGFIDSLAAYEREAPGLAELGDAVASALEETSAAQMEISTAAIPACALPESARGHRLERDRLPSQAIAAGYADVLEAITGGASRAFASACGTCGRRVGCRGVAAEYLRLRGDGALPPRGA